MIIPSVMYLEMAKDTLAKLDPEVIAAEAKEFHCLGDQRKIEILASLAPSMPEADWMLAGYLLGIETARILLAMNVKAAQAGVSI